MYTIEIEDGQEAPLKPSYLILGLLFMVKTAFWSEKFHRRHPSPLF